MQTCYLDSNFLINFANEDSLRHDEAVLKLKKLVSDQTLLFISSLVLDEFLHITRLTLIYKKAKNVEETLKIKLEQILKIPFLQMLNPPIELEKQSVILDIMEKYHLLPRDAYHFWIMQENNIDLFATFDNDFETVFRLTTLKNPL